MGTWDELDTEVNVNLDTVELDELIDFLLTIQFLNLLLKLPKDIKME